MNKIVRTVLAALSANGLRYSVVHLEHFLLNPTRVSHKIYLGNLTHVSAIIMAVC